MVLHRKGCEQQRSLFPNRQTLACLSIIQTDEESVLSSRKTGQWHVSLIDDNLTHASDLWDSRSNVAEDHAGRRADC